MKTVWPILQVTVFLFFAGWLLFLLTGRPLPLSTKRTEVCVPSCVQGIRMGKPSPIEMLRKLDYRSACGRIGGEQ